MVKVISVHHFLSQDVASVPRPTAVSLAGQSILLMSTENLNVEVRDLKQGGKVSHTFPTIDQVSVMLHCSIGNYVATLEGKPGEKGAGVRIYCNWYNTKMEAVRPRIASRVTPSLRSDQPGLDNMLDMIEFPHRDFPLQIAVCSSTGNFMVAAVNVLVIYKYSMKTQEMSKTKFIDFEDCIHIFHNFIPKEITLNEDVIGCLNESEVHVFKVKIVDVNDEKNLRSLSVYSFSSESDSSLLIEQNNAAKRKSSCASNDDKSESSLEKLTAYKNVTLEKDCDSDASNSHHLPGYFGNVKRSVNHVFIPDALTAKNKIILPDVEKANREFHSQSGPKIMEQILGPRSVPPLNATNGSNQTGLEVIVKLVPMSSQADQDTMVEAEAVTLVYCKLTKTEETREHLKNMKILPVYWREFRVRKSESAAAEATSVQPFYLNRSFSHPLQSSWHSHLMSLTMTFTSTMESYIYHLPGHIRKPGRGLGVQRIATCPFTSAVGKTVLESATVMHAFTLTGLETYTLKSGHSTILEAEVMDNKTKACPNAEMPVCLVGLRPFIGVQEIIASNSHLVLLSKSGDECNKEDLEDIKPKWTMYNLSLPTPLALAKSMIELANLSKSLNPRGYLELISEAHIVLRTSLHQLTWQMATTTIGKGELEAQLQMTKEAYQGSCQTLGNYYALFSQGKIEMKLALPYYRMSGKPILLLLKDVQEAWKKECPNDKVLPPGLVYYIKEVIIDPLEDEDTLEANLADMIIEMLGKFSPDTLATLVLKSPSFRQFKSSKILSHIRDHSSLGSSMSHVLAFVILSVEQGNKSPEDMECSRRCLRSVSPGKLSAEILEYHEFLIDDHQQQLSDVASWLRDAVPSTFVEVLVSLIKSDVYSLQTVLHLLIGSLVSSSTSFDIRTNNDASILQLFLEAYFVDILNVDSDTAVILDGDQLQALHTLVRSYLTSLSVPVRFEEKNIDCNMFGSRFLYLDLLPPFKSSDFKDALMNAESPEFWCQNSLLKLQSLLCSQLCRGASCKSIVQGYLDIKPDTIGYLSLRILCLDDAKSSVPLLVDHHPEVLLPFAKEHNVDLGTWKLMLKCLQDELGSKKSEQLHEEWYNAMQEILDHLAKTLLLDTFLEVLPGPQSNEDFQSYIQLCRKNQKAHQIQNLIVTTGHKLLSTLTF